MVSKVRALHDDVPGVAEEIDEAIDQVVTRARDALEAGDLEQVGYLMNVNHGLLAALGVSSEALDSACHVAREAGAWGAKLT